MTSSHTGLVFIVYKSSMNGLPERAKDPRTNVLSSRRSSVNARQEEYLQNGFETHSETKRRQ